MSPVVIAFTLFVLALIIGVAVIGRVPSTLHTPLMSGANSIHGVVLVGVILVAASSNTLLGHILVFFAALLGTLNVVGGYVVTDRMLEMFKVKQNAPDNLDYSADLGAPVSLEIHESRAIAASDIVPEDELVQVTQASATQAKIVEVVEE